MSMNNNHLHQIIDDLESHIETSCSGIDPGKASDFSVENCNDAFLMLQEAQQVQPCRFQKRTARKDIAT